MWGWKWSAETETDVRVSDLRKWSVVSEHLGLGQVQHHLPRSESE